MKRPVQEITRHTKEIDDLTREITRYEVQLGEAGGSLSGAEIRAKMDSLNEQRVKLQRDQKSVTLEKEKMRVRIQGLKDQIQSIKIRVWEEETKLTTINGLLRDLEDVKTQLRKVNDDIQVCPWG
jgi:chromosome segregation ATPase